MTDTLRIPKEALEAAQKPRNRSSTPAQPLTYAIDTRSRAYVVAALRSEAAIVAAAPEGERNSAINNGVYSIAGFISEKLLTEQEVRGAFEAAAKSNGEWDDRADGVIADLIDRAIEAGKDNPRPIPEAPEPRVVLYVVDDGDEWPDTQPLPEAAEPPELPAEMLPEPFADWNKYISESMNAPLASPAAAVIAAAGATIGRAAAIQPKANVTTFLVTPNLWGADTDHPGSMKSARIAAALNPLRSLDREAGDAFDQDEMLRESQRIATKGHIEVLTAELRKGQASGKGRKTEGELEEIRAELQAALQEQADLPSGAPRIVVTDSTTQALGEIHRNNPRGLLLLRDELSGFLNSFNRQGREGDREFYLEAWNGDGSFTWDTISRGKTSVRNLCISVYGGIQPGKLRQHIEDAVDGDADGLLQRFQLLTYPARRKKYKRHDQAPPEGLLERIQEIFRKLRKAPEQLGWTGGGDDQVILKFDADAQVVFNEWLDDLEHRLISDELQNVPAFTGHLSKYRSLMPALALIFHLIDFAAGQATGTRISAAHAQRAAAWCEYLELHARKVYATELNKPVATAELLLERIEADQIMHGQTVRDVHRKQWAGLTNRDAVTAGLSVLQEHGFIRLVSIPTRGRATEVIALHPELRKVSDDD